MIFVNVVTVVINIEIHFLAHVLKIGIKLKSLHSVICLQRTNGRNRKTSIFD